MADEKPAEVMYGEQVVTFEVPITAGDVADLMRGRFGLQHGAVVDEFGYGSANGHNLVAGRMYRFVDYISAGK